MGRRRQWTPHVTAVSETPCHPSITTFPHLSTCVCPAVAGEPATMQADLDDRQTEQLTCVKRWLLLLHRSVLELELLQLLEQQ